MSAAPIDADAIDTRVLVTLDASTLLQLAEAWSGITEQPLTISVDPGTARRLGEVWAEWHAVDEALEAARPRWFDDVVSLHTAAVHADIAAGHAPTTVKVPVLRLLGGERS